MSDLYSTPVNEPWHSMLRVVFVPFCGMLISSLVSFLGFGIIGIFERIPLKDQAVIATWIVTTLLGVVTALLINRRRSFLGDLFAWVIPAMLFAYTWLSFRPLDSTDQRGLLATDCGSNGCVYSAFITVPLLFSAGYSLATLMLRLRRPSAAAPT
jgi:hypothetical protein